MLIGRQWLTRVDVWSEDERRENEVVTLSCQEFSKRTAVMIHDVQIKCLYFNLLCTQQSIFTALRSCSATENNSVHNMEPKQTNNNDLLNIQSMLSPYCSILHIWINVKLQVAANNIFLCEFSFCCLILEYFFQTQSSFCSYLHTPVFTFDNYW